MTDITVPHKGFVWTFPAKVERVIDGDTVVCSVLWQPEDEDHGVDVRVEGINARELRAEFGGEARDYAMNLVPVGTAVTLTMTRREKYGRVLARITLPDGRDFSTLMLTAKASDGTTPLAVPYLP